MELLLVTDEVSFEVLHLRRTGDKVRSTIIFISCYIVVQALQAIREVIASMVQNLEVWAYLLTVGDDSFVDVETVMLATDHVVDMV